MMKRIAWTTVGLVVFSAVLVVLVANHARNRNIQRELRDLATSEIAPAVPTNAALASLPAPVQRYLRFAIPAGHAPVHYAEVTQEGQFRTHLNGPWLAMTAQQYVYTGRPAYVWDARVRMLPGLSMTVMDSYQDRQGAVDARLLGALPVRLISGPRVSEASLQRYLAEAPWLPTALWPSNWLRWEPIDTTHARAIASDGYIKAEVVFTFDDGGRIVGMAAERYRDVDGTQVLTPWLGHFSDYQRFGDLMVPARGEVGWLINGVEFPYVRVEVQNIRYRTQ